MLALHSPFTSQVVFVRDYVLYKLLISMIYNNKYLIIVSRLPKHNDDYSTYVINKLSNLKSLICPISRKCFKMNNLNSRYGAV